MIKISVINGPNINILEKRKIYGDNSLVDIESMCLSAGKQRNCNIECFQSNHEGKIIEFIQNLKSDGIVINAAAYSHTSIAILDSLSILSIPIVEVHISNIFAREKFRRKSYISSIAQAVVSGMGIDGYKYAIEYLLSIISKNPIPSN